MTVALKPIVCIRWQVIWQFNMQRAIHILLSLHVWYCLYCNKFSAKRLITLNIWMMSVVEWWTLNIGCRSASWQRTATSWKSFWKHLEGVGKKVGADEIDLLHSIHVKREETDNIVRKCASKFSKFGATIQLKNGWGLRRLIREMRTEDNPFTVQNGRSWLRRYWSHLTALHLILGAGWWIR